MRLIRKILFLAVLAVTLQYAGFLGCSGNDGPNLLAFPAIVTVDSAAERVFVIDNQDNRINVINASTNQVVIKDKDKSLLNEDDPQLLPLFPANGSVASLGGGVSRLFVIGANGTPSQEITVLDYSGGESFAVAGFSPIGVPAASTNDVLVGIAIDPVFGRVWVSNASTGMLHAFDINTGLEVPNSPIMIGNEPGQISVDSTSGLLAVANASQTMVSMIDLTDLTLAPMLLDVGVMSRSVSLTTNGNGTVLFVSGSQVNTALVYVLNLADIANSNQIFNLVPSAPSDPRPDPELLTGSLNLVFSANLTDGRLGGFYTQSSGDVLALDLNQDFGNLSPTIISVGAVSGEGISGFLNTANQVTSVYFVSPGTSVMTVIDPLTNEFIDQIQ